MSRMKKDEMAILKALMVKLDNDDNGYVMLVANRYHTEFGDNGKINRDKSRYEYIAKVMKHNDWVALINECMDDSRRLETFAWENDDWHIFVNKDSTNYAVGKWFINKLKKPYSWDDGMKVLHGWKKGTAKRVEGFAPKDAYATSEYKALDGELISIEDKDAVLKHVGELLIHSVMMKSKLPKFVAVAAPTAK